MARFSYHDESITEEIQQEFCSLTVTQNAIAGRWMTLGAGLGEW